MTTSILPPGIGGRSRPNGDDAGLLACADAACIRNVGMAEAETDKGEAVLEKPAAGNGIELGHGLRLYSDNGTRIGNPGLLQSDCLPSQTSEL